MQQFASTGLRLRARQAVDDQRLGDHVEGRDARHRAQELADIANGRAADVENLPRLGGGEIDQRAAMVDADPAGIATIIAEDHLQDRRFSGA
ncbi:hypothetical protein ACVWZV_002373 [Bradyrhizobium sp. GM5.1]